MTPVGTKNLFNVEYWQHVQTEGIFPYRRKQKRFDGICGISMKINCQ